MPPPVPALMKRSEIRKDTKKPVKVIPLKSYSRSGRGHFEYHRLAETDFRSEASNTLAAF